MNTRTTNQGKGVPALFTKAAPAGQGFKYVRLLGTLLEHLHEAGRERDRAGNRQLFYDQYATLVLLYFLNPVVSSLRGLQQLTTLAAVQRRWGVRRTALGSLSEAAQVFDATLLHAVMRALARRAWQRGSQGQHEAGALEELIAIDGSLLPALPRMVWAVWKDERQRAAKLHVAFAALRQIPVDARITAGTGAERAELRRMVEPGGFYVFDRGYRDYRLLVDLHALPCSFVARLQERAAYGVHHEQPLSAAARAAGVQQDCWIERLSTDHHQVRLPALWRVVRVGTDRAHADGTPVALVLVTNRLDLDADLIALAYRYRWSVELFFRWLKCVLGCRHLLSHSENGVQLQVYMALIASLLMSLWVDHAPTKRTYEMLCYYLSGWATTTEVIAHIDRLHLKAPPSNK